ncbi:MAG: hypothetical protein C6Y22_22225 [Hapalosiphonaceae cyanobacterium JJU2]|nr:MAG: hypothetical protein C6Y22_22225 [Hapalosiphonaceae cyanobacterium JJU2]
MSRRQRRFSALERAYKLSGGSAAPDSRLAGYIEFKKGNKKIKVEKKLTAAERKRVAYAILPFGLSAPSSPTDADRYRIAITNYSNSARTGVLTLANNKVGYAVINAANVQDPNFYPAALRVFVKSSDTKTTPVSGVTGKEYSRTPGATYTIPFGRTVTDVTNKKDGTAESTVDDADQLDVRDSLATAVKSKAGVLSVSFLPEEFKSPQADLTAGT